MSKLTDQTAACLCGAVRITAGSVSRDVGACHCNMCRKWGGGPLMVVDCGTDVSIGGEENVSVFDSSRWAERGFCSRCGTHLFYRLKQSGQTIVPVGLFAAHNQFSFDRQVFIDEKPPFYQFSNETNNMTGAEVFEKFGSAS